MRLAARTASRMTGEAHQTGEEPGRRWLTADSAQQQELGGANIWGSAASADA